MALVFAALWFAGLLPDPSIRTQHAPAPLKRFASVVELRKWAAAGGAAAWRRAERLKHARWQLEVDEYRVAHGLVGDVE